MSFASMGGNGYFKDSILAKCISAEILLAPFVAADVALAFFGIAYVLSSALVLALMAPASMIITFYFFSERVASQDLKIVSSGEADVSSKAMEIISKIDKPMKNIAEGTSRMKFRPAELPLITPP